MKKVFSLLITLAMLISTVVVPMSASADASVWDGETIDVEWAGEGTQASPYLITSAAELAGLAKTLFDADSTTVSTEKMPIAENYVKYNSSNVATFAICFAYTGKYFKLTTDIDLGNKEWLPIGRLGMRFDGNFDGDGHVVKNVYMRKEYSAMGLFGGTGKNARIVNLGVDGVDILTDVQTGKVVDYTAGGDLTKGQNRVSGLGAIVGAMAPGGTEAKPMMESCFVKNASIKIKSKSNTTHYGMGGLFGTAGYNQGGTIYVKNCYVKDIDFAGVASVGALFGTNQGYFNQATEAVRVYMTNCYAGGEITLTSTRLNPSDNLYNFGYLYARTNSKYTKVYSVVSEYMIRDNIQGDGEQCTDKAGIVSNIATLGGWSADNEKSPINDGYQFLHGKTHGRAYGTEHLQMIAGKQQVTVRRTIRTK